MSKKSTACLCVFFCDGIAQGIFIGDNKVFGLEVLVDVNKWEYEFCKEEIQERINNEEHCPKRNN